MHVFDMQLKCHLSMRLGWMFPEIHLPAVGICEAQFGRLFIRDHAIAPHTAIRDSTALLNYSKMRCTIEYSPNLYPRPRLYEYGLENSNRSRLEISSAQKGK